MPEIMISAGFLFLDKWHHKQPTTFNFYNTYLQLYLSDTYICYIFIKKNAICKDILLVTVVKVREKVGVREPTASKKPRNKMNGTLQM